MVNLFEGKFEGHPYDVSKNPICVLMTGFIIQNVPKYGQKSVLLFLAFQLMQELLQIAPFHSHQLLISKINTVPVSTKKTLTFCC